MLVMGTSSAAEYDWPLREPRVLTSSFGEYRPGRYHAGVDLRSAVGNKVYAPADGYVSRLRCSPSGYGKAVYIQFADGNSVVFGHLDDFAPALRAYVQKEQHARESYTVDLHVEPGLFPVKRGDLVALSGQTGIGAPHLHFELRDPNEWPINPVLTGLTWPDSVAPTIRKIVIVPDGPDSTVNGDIAPVVLAVQAGKCSGRYVCEPVRVSGRVGFGVDVLDTAENGGGKFGVRTLNLKVDDAEKFRLEIDRFSYDNIRDGAVTYHPYLKDEGRFMLLWRWAGNQSEVFPKGAGDGWVTAGADSTSIDIEAGDFLGNKATVTIPLLREAPAPVPVPQADQTGYGEISTQILGDWMIVTATFTKPEPVTPEFSVAFDGKNQPLTFRRVNPTVFRAGVASAASVREIEISCTHAQMPEYQRSFQVFTQGQPSRMLKEGKAEIKVGEQSPYGRLIIEGKTDPVASPVLSDVLMLGPAETPLNEPVEISIPVPVGVLDASRFAIYRQTGSLWCMLDTRRAGDRFVASTPSLGTFMVREDDEAPVLTDIVPSEPVAGKRPAIRATVTDSLSGIKDVRVTCDGQWLLFAYDPERQVIEWEQDEDLSVGQHELVFAITDCAGNTTPCKHQVCVLDKPQAPAQKQQTAQQKPANKKVSGR